MNHALVLACGNPLGGDDGIAVGLARYFRAEFCEPETDIRPSQQWARELAGPISQSDIVLFVDASVTLPPGKIQFKIVEPAQEFSSSMTHTISAEALLARLGATLFPHARMRLPSHYRRRVFRSP